MHPSANLHQFRADFIRSFRRIGKNTTPGDAQFLRILIEKDDGMMVVYKRSGEQ
jgi:hypothetical protein